MRNLFRALGLLVVVLITQRCDAQSQLPTSSLCDLQVQLSEGEHRAVRVEGVLLGGSEKGDYLVAAGCSERSTWVEFALKSRRNWAELQRMVNEPYKGQEVNGPGEPVLVVLEGEFYGPPEPDPKLPEGMRKVYHPGWDRNATTKLVVSAVESVKALPADHPCAAPKSLPTQWPCFQRASPPYKKPPTSQ